MDHDQAAWLALLLWLAIAGALHHLIVNVRSPASMVSNALAFIGGALLTGIAVFMLWCAFHSFCIS